MKKAPLLFVLINSALFLFAGDILLLSFPRKMLEPAGIVYEKLADSEYHYTPELGAYAAECRERMKQYLFSISSKPSDLQKTELIATWILQDTSGKTPELCGEYESYVRFNIIESGSSLYYISFVPPLRMVHFDVDGDVYFQTPFLYLKKVRIINNRLYLYNLEDDKWVLDDIHHSGEFFYVKHPLVQTTLP